MAASSLVCYGSKFAGVFVGSLLFINFFGGPRISTGMSMYPTLPYTATPYLDERVTLRLFGAAAIHRGDVVVLQKPTARWVLVAKRVVGLPGDVVCVDPVLPERGHVLVPKGHIWVAGDNRDNSTDSRDFGPVPIALVRSRLIVQLWSPIRILRNPMASVYEVDKRGHPSER